VQLRHVIRALARRHTVDVLVVRAGDQAYVERYGHARVLRVPVGQEPVEHRVDSFRRALRRQLEGADYEVVHFRDGWSGVPVLELRARLGYTAVFDAARSPMAEAAIRDIEIATQLSRDEDGCLRGADLVLAPSEPAQRYFAAIVAPERVRVVPPGVDVDAFDWAEPRRQGPPVVLYAGSLAGGRGVRVLLRAMLDVVARSPAELWLAGRPEPGFGRSLDATIRELGLAQRVVLLGEVAHEEMSDLIAEATVCVAPGALELAPRPIALYPTKLLEFLACRRPVVAPRRGTVTMLLRDRVHGLLFHPGDPGDLARQLLRLLADGELRRTLADAGYELVRRSHTASGTRRALLTAYAELGARCGFREQERGAAGPRGHDELQSGPDTLVSVGELLEERGEAPRAAPSRPAAVDLDTERFAIPGATATEITAVEMAPVSDLTGSQRGAAGLRSPAGEGWAIDEHAAQPGPQAALHGRARAGGSVRSLPASGAPQPRFIAGEVQVPPAPPGSEADELEDTAFTAVSALLSSAARGALRDTEPPAARSPESPAGTDPAPTGASRGRRNTTVPPER
jgi:glycosyltransferase involved in cell wall biosynthesis